MSENEVVLPSTAEQPTITQKDPHLGGRDVRPEEVASEAPGVAKGSFTGKQTKFLEVGAPNPLDSLRRVPRNFGKILPPQQDLPDKKKNINTEIQPPEAEVVINLINRELTDTSSSQDVGVVLKRLKEQTELGIGTKAQEIKVADSFETSIPSGLIDSIRNNILFRNEDIPTEETLYGSGKRYIDKNTGTSFDVDAYTNVLKSQKREFKDVAEVKLVMHEGEMLVVTEHPCGDRIKITQIIEAALPRTQEYEEYLDNYVPGKPNPLREKENYAKVRHLLIQDTVSGKVFDVRTLLPEDWELRLEYHPDNELSGFGQDMQKKYVSYGNLKSPQLIIGLLHEHGHNLYTYNDDPDDFKRANELWQQSRVVLGGAGNLDPEVFNETKKLLVKNERGASAHAFQILRTLKNNGLDTGIEVKEYAALVNTALSNYEKGFPGGESQFLRPNQIKDKVPTS